MHAVVFKLVEINISKLTIYQNKRFSQFIRPIDFQGQPPGDYNSQTLSVKVALATSRDLSCSSLTTFLWISFPFEKMKAMVLSFLTNLYNNYFAANLMEFKAAKQDFHLETHYNLLPGNAVSFAANLEKFSKQFGYGFLLNIPTTHLTDATNANTFVYSNQIHILETWNRVTDKHIAINANKIWGTCNWS
jgi:hypothetical protein